MTGQKCASVRNQIVSMGASVLCLQETKISAWTHTLLSETVGPDLADNFAYLPAFGASGGILIVASERFFRVQQNNLNNTYRFIDYHYVG